MASSCNKLVVICTLAALTVFLSSCSADYQLSPNFYDNSCPWISEIVAEVLISAILQNPRMGASLLRLHFHDCFVNGCDGSVLLDDTPTFTGEKTAVPNNNSLKGFEVIDQIKTKLEKECPGVVSCADILAIAARESVAVLGGWIEFKDWEVKFGRKDSRTASRAAANNGIPNPNMDLANLTSIFNKNGLSPNDLVVLSGAHTIGQARCTSFRNHIYNDTNIDPGFANLRRRNCPKNTGNGDDNSASLDVRTPTTFDNTYYNNLIRRMGLLHSDQQLFGVDPTINSNVVRYSTNSTAFLAEFGAAMVKMGDIAPPRGARLEIRKDCRKVNN